jgi:hypothetical protein
MSKKMSIIFLLSASLSTLCMDNVLPSKGYMHHFGPIDIAMIKMRVAAVGVDGIHQEMQKTENRCIAKQEAKAKRFYDSQ